MKFSKLLARLLMIVPFGIVDGDGGGGGSDRADLESMFAERDGEDDGSSDDGSGESVDGNADDELDLGDEDDGQQQNATDDDPVFEIPVGDGKTVQKKQSELLAEASKYHGANQKFEEAAAIRKDAEAKLAQLPEREQQLGMVLQHYIQQSQALMPQEPNWRQILLQDQQNGTNNFQMLRLDWETRQRDLQQAMHTKQLLDQRNAEAQAVSLQGRLSEAATKIRAAIPEWTDPKKAAEGAKAVGDYLVSQGIPAEMQAQMDTAEVFLIARKAMLYDQAIAKRNATRNGTKEPPRVERPGSRQVNPPRDQMARANAGKAFKADPSVKTLAAFFE